MKNLKRALLLLLVLVIGMPTVALAAYESMSEAFTNKILKISLENGYNLLANGCVYDADLEDEIYDLYDADGESIEATDDYIPVYDVNVPAGTEYVYMYTWQDPDNGSAFAHSFSGNYSVGMATVNYEEVDAYLDGSGYNVWTNIVQHSDDMYTVNLKATDANGADPYVQTIAKVKIPVAKQLEGFEDEESENYGKTRVVVFNQQNDNYPFALRFHETEMNVTSVVAEDVQLSMEESFTWSVDPANIVNMTPDLSVHPIGANSITDVTWTSSDPSIVSVENVTAPNAIDKETDSCTISAAELVPHKTGEVTITVKGGDYEKTTTITVTANNCTHTTTAEIIEQVEGAEKHNVITACAFCGEQVGDAVPADCADGDSDSKCDACGGEVIAEQLADYTIELDKQEDTIWFFAADQQIPTGYEAYADAFPAASELKATIKVNDIETEEAEIVWNSSDSAVATVADGVVTAAGAGEATITATVNGVEASCTVKVESFIAPAYMNVGPVGEFDYSVNHPEGVKKYIIDLTDDTQARTITISAPLYQNVNDVKTLASMQGVTWEIMGAAECVETVVNDDFTITATFTGMPGVVSFKPVMLNGYTNVSLPIYVTNGFVTEVNIVREDGKAWDYGEKETIGGVERDVIEIVEGSSITAVSSATNVTQAYNGWLVSTLDDSYATVSTGLSFNGASMDLSKLDVGLYSVLVRVPTYEQDYNIDYKGTNPQDSTNSEMIYIRVVEKNAIGDVSGDGNINASDAVLILQAVAGSTLTEAQKAAADMNNDGTIDANDAVLVLQYSAE